MPKSDTVIHFGICHCEQIKETRRAVKDSESGVEKMAIGHHIHNRGHVVEKKYNKKTGDKELNQNFHNMDECTTKKTHALCIQLEYWLRSPTLPAGNVA